MKNLSIILGLGALWAYLNWGDMKEYFNPPPDYSAQHPEGVVLYATSWCGYCKKARAFLKENNIAYVEYDIEKDTAGKVQYDALNGNGVPLMVVKGHVINGYNPAAIKRYLNTDSKN
jgi:glutaredoxin